MKFLFRTLVYLWIYQIGNGFIIQNLRGIWTVENIEKGYHLPAQVPGGIYSDLMKNKELGDVFYGSNDIDTRWVSKLDWNYSYTFEVNDTLLGHSFINLILDGVDTFSKVIINTVEVGKTENMFVQYTFNIKPYLVAGSNDIQIQLKSPVNAALAEYENQSKDYVVLPKCVPKQYNGECHVNHIRKMQASFSWDWGPALPSVGIWKQLFIEAYNSTVVRYVTVDISSDSKNNCWNVVVYTYFSKDSRDSLIYGTLNIKLHTDVAVITKIDKIIVGENKNGDFAVTTNITVSKTYVREWWPNGYGKTNLYSLQVYYTNLQKTEESKKNIKIGFRTLELVQDAIDSGRRFYFRVNGIPIFAKGSNLIPINILPELGQNKETVRFLLKSAQEAHMNMLRVWGGGVYESDIFYEVADELGILIWQDFMFACSMYPSQEKFLKNVQKEVKHQVRRLQHHPSIALWAGNNENEAALQQNWYNTNTNYEVYKRDYIKLYISTVKTECHLYDSLRPYLTSSPTNGLQSDLDGYLAQNPQSRFYGDVHFYNYIADGWQVAIYPTTRFTSEYGYQSLPSISTLLTATNNKSDLNINSTFLRNRQHLALGYETLTSLISYQLNLPSSNHPNFFKAYVYYGQIVQAMAVKIQTEHYRQWRSNLNDIGEGYTMGALYWQLNDVWAAPTWSSIDFKMNWKMLHYFAKMFFAPIIITGYTAIDKALSVFVVSDVTEVVNNASVSLSIYKWNSFTPIHQELLYMNVLPGMSQQVHAKTLNIFLTPYGKKQCGTTTTQCFVQLSITKYNKSIAPDNHIFPVPLKTANLSTPKIKVVNVQQIDNSRTEFNITIRSSTIALFVWLEAKGIRGRFSENGYLQVTENKSIYFFAEKPTTVSDFSASLSITNLLDTNYQ